MIRSLLLRLCKKRRAVNCFELTDSLGTCFFTAGNKV
jgi:hypothetical protein